MRFWVLRQKIHPVWLIAALSCGAIGGIFLVSGTDFRIYGAGWLLVSLVLTIGVFWYGRLYLIAVIVVAGGILGAWRQSQVLAPLLPYRELMGSECIVRATVLDDPEISSKGTVLRLKVITINGLTLPGKLWVTAGEGAAVSRSDIVTIKGTLSEGFGGFTASMYRAALQKHELPAEKDIGLIVREWFAGAVRHSIPEPEAALGLGFLTGQHRNLPETLDESLRTVGLTHIVVASGYNLTILVEAARRLLAKHTRYGAALFGGIMIVGFLAVTGMSPSMSRAGLVAGLSLGAWYYGRQFHPVVLLLLAAAATLLIDPSYAWGDLGWQLSFAAFFGVMIVAPLVHAYFYGARPPGMLRQIAVETIAAWACTVPVIIAAFGQYSVVAIIVNVLILPLLPLTMLMTFLAGVGTLTMPAIASIWGLPAHLLLSFIIETSSLFASLPWAAAKAEFGVAGVLTCYGLILGFCLYVWRYSRGSTSTAEENMV